MQTQTFNIALPKDLLIKVDSLAKKEYRNRSELIREALRVYLSDKQEMQELFTNSAKAMRSMEIKDEEQVNNIVSDYRHGRKSR